MTRFIPLFLLLFVATPYTYAGEPQRDKGISVHVLPKRVADLSGKPWGFQVTYAPYLKPEPSQPVLQSLKDMLAFIKKQDQFVIDNGLWVVTTHPDAYSKHELDFQNKVKKDLPKHNIPLFWARGTELKNGFKRY